MSIIIFIIVLGVLILVHEFGHFLFAKKNGVRVDEFGIGFPPRLFRLFKWKGTDFTLNLIPFGGFVKIFGENPEEEEVLEDQKKEHFTHKPKIIQASILVAGVFFNFLFGWFLISFGLFQGVSSLPEQGVSGYPVSDVQLVVTSVLNDSPASDAGLKTGDKILKAENSGSVLDVEEMNPENLSEFISGSENNIDFIIGREKEQLAISVTPLEGIVQDKKAIGIGMAMIGTLKLPVHLAIIQGFKTSVSLLWTIATDLFTFLGRAVTGQANFSEIAGPVGIVGLVGDASDLGFMYLIQFTAFISLNLAVINLLPFPALDGGRLLFLCIESIKGSKINPKIVNGANIAGFVFLLLLMAVITISDIQKIL